MNTQPEQILENDLVKQLTGITLKVFAFNNKRGFRVELHPLIFTLTSFVWFDSSKLALFVIHTKAQARQINCPDF
ncbi:MAG: hypothetical protein IH950_14865 [Bacteroidetes bacterium]|nr:hypothetical protein [Bacteroidota bacterium]MCH8035024.1 hypothetical protein [Bacteroidota bacterium]